MKPTVRDLFESAKSARTRSYSPYSGHQVGCAIRTKEGKIHTGCNVENSSYGATICAERVAIQKAISEGSHSLSEVMVVTDSTPPWPPCGMCRQVIAEFADPHTLIHFANLSGTVKTLKLSELFPEAFVPSHLQRK